MYKIKHHIHGSQSFVFWLMNIYGYDDIRASLQQQEYLMRKV
jgi:hypothetical protein